MKLSKKKEMLKPLILLIGGLFLSLCIQVTFAKEIEVTKEWTKVGENEMRGKSNKDRDRQAAVHNQHEHDPRQT